MTTMRFEGMSVLITGAASGFGRLAAQRFAEEGARLTIQDIAKDGLEETAELVRRTGRDVVTLPGDVGEEEHHQALTALAVSTYGKLDVAMNNAGVGHPLAPVFATPLDQYDHVMRVNARGVFAGMKFQIPAMKPGGGGAILNVSSVAGLVGAKNLGAYAASKHAVIGMTKAAADECARDGIRVNAICPAFTVTPMVEQMTDMMRAAHDMTRDEAMNRLAQRIPMRRVARVEEVVQAMLWIVSPENSFMTGQAVAIDGGLTTA